MSERKIASNRANASASTGPKSAHGRARSAKNAFRHGLSLPIQSDPALSEEAEALAQEIVGKDADAEMQELARRIAEAQIDLRRVRCTRRQLLSDALSDPDYKSVEMYRKKLAVLVRCIRVLGPNATLPDDVVEFLYSKPDGPHKFVAVLADRARQLRALDRYERRALSRRKFATRALDRRVAQLTGRHEVIRKYS